MLYLKLFEEFNPRESVTVNGEPGKVVSEDGDKITVRFFRPMRTEIIDRKDINKVIKCLSQCDKRIVGEGDDRHVKCFFCGKEQRFGK